jgi:hypothetical protein
VPRRRARRPARDLHPHAEKATLSAINKAKNLHRLTVPLASAAATTPFTINAHPGGLQQGVLDTKRFLRDWAALSAAADYRKGRYAAQFRGRCPVHEKERPRRGQGDVQRDGRQRDARRPRLPARDRGSRGTARSTPLDYICLVLVL